MIFTLHNLYPLESLYFRKPNINLKNQEIHIRQNCQLRKYLRVFLNLMNLS